VSLPRVQCQEVEEKVCCTCTPTETVAGVPTQGAVPGGVGEGVLDCTPTETVAGVPAQGAVPGGGGEGVLYLYSY
jgi:hypothetical protein